MKHLYNNEVQSQSSNCHLVPFLAEMSQDSKMVTWGSIMVHIPLESSIRVNAEPSHLSRGYGKEYKMALQQ